MAYADGIRTTTATMNGVADLIEGIFTSTFPLSWLTWVPTYSASGTMTFTSVTTSYAYYIRIGGLVLFHISASGTVGGTPSTGLRFTVPVTALNGTAFGCVASDNGIVITSSAFLTSLTVAEVFKTSGGNWTATGLNGAFTVSGFYRV